MSTSYNDLPSNLPPPVDDGAASHLEGQVFPDLALPSTAGTMVRLATRDHRVALYMYPMTGRPGVALPEGWDQIPGARGCTPQSCGFRDHHTELKELGTDVFGLSSQATDYQREVHDRLHLPFELLSDMKFELKRLLRLPTFVADGKELYKRMTLILEQGRIVKVFYPVFPPDQNAAEVVSWLRGQNAPELDRNRRPMSGV